jgi:hypothetical protein
MPGDTPEETEKAKREMVALKADSLHFLRVHRLILEQLTKRFHYIKFSERTLINITKMLKVDLMQFN